MAKSTLDLNAIDALARHLCERLPIGMNEIAKKYVSRIWETYLRIVSKPNVALADEALHKKQFEKTVASTLKN